MPVRSAGRVSAHPRNLTATVPPQDEEVLTKYGFLYTNYRPGLSYWETTEMFRKFIISFIPVRACCVCVRVHACDCGEGSCVCWRSAA